MDNEIEQKEFNLGYKARVKEILKQQRKREAQENLSNRREKWIKDQFDKNERERKLKRKEEEEVNECINLLHKIEEKQSRADERHLQNLQSNKTFSGREEYSRIYSNKQELERKEKELEDKRYLDFLEKEYKHKEILESIKKKQKIMINKKINQHQDKMAKVENTVKF